MKEEKEIKYYLDGKLVDKDSIDWTVDNTVKVIGNCAYVTTISLGHLGTRHKAVSSTYMHPKEPTVVEPKSPNEFITVTMVKSVVKPAIRTKIIEATRKAKKSPEKRDSLGNTPDFYKQLGVDPPEDFKEDLENEIFEIKKSDYELVEKKSKIRHQLIEFMVDSDDIGSILYVGKDFTVTVKETVEEVEEKIKKSKDGVQ